ncbi:hypothetical protein BLOT_004992 [Blomia tropicalis]|nr:hypothetical protein BLOT_004992 [Blomia tropicalis]
MKNCVRARVLAVIEVYTQDSRQEATAMTTTKRSIEMHQLLVVNLIQHYKKTMKGKKEKNIEASQVTERKKEQEDKSDRQQLKWPTLN